jgi:hypothetical protein
MSLLTPRPSNADQEPPLFAKFADKHDNAFESDEQDRESTAEEFSRNMAGSSGGFATDISAAQKMISATWGSILTSLLGMKLDAQLLLHLGLTYVNSHTSRCRSSTPTITSSFPLVQRHPKVPLVQYLFQTIATRARSYRLLSRSVLGRR